MKTCANECSRVSIARSVIKDESRGVIKPGGRQSECGIPYCSPVLGELSVRTGDIAQCNKENNKKLHNMDMDKLRQEIDEIDTQMCDLFARRMQVV